jgi:hypothetical protein
MKSLSVRRLISLLSASALVATLAVASLPAAASAAAPSKDFFNGFEKNTAGWFGVTGSTITRVPSGDTSTAYATGVAAATGGYYARLGMGTNTTCPNFQNVPIPWYQGPYTNWGGTSSTFPTGGYSTGVDIYLDVAYATAHLDTRFDWGSSISDPSGNFRRDFVFNVASDATGFVISGGNNSNRCSADPASGNTPVQVTAPGWYTFEHTFTGTTGGALSVYLQLINKSTSAVVGHWLLSTPSDIIGTTVGGNNIGWFEQNEFNGLAIDNSWLTLATHHGR